MKATVSRRQMLASVPAATAALSGLLASAAGATTDPVLAAIEKHRQAIQALSALHEPPEALVTQLARAEVDAFLAWLTTPPVTLAGVIATLEYASHQPYVSDHHPDDHVYTNLAEAAQYDPGDGDPDGILKAGEQFPAMIAAALRKMAAKKSL
jgi:hypothetical protein